MAIWIDISVTCCSFTIAGDFRLHSLSISLDATIGLTTLHSYISSLVAGSSAFVFCVLLYSPGGRVVQVGGYTTYHESDRLWMR